jgi:hypothetical protein
MDLYTSEFEIYRVADGSCYYTFVEDAVFASAVETATGEYYYRCMFWGSV